VKKKKKKKKYNFLFGGRDTESINLNYK